MNSTCTRSASKVPGILRDAMRSRAVSQPALARAAGVSPRTVAHWVAGDDPGRSPIVKNLAPLVGLCRALNLDPIQLLAVMIDEEETAEAEPLSIWLLPHKLA